MDLPIIGGWLLIGLIAFGLIANILAIGKPPRPVRPGIVVVILVMNVFSVIVVLALMARAVPSW